MAGGDGSQAIVAQVAMERALPYVCVPAGTRNHLALDLGVDRDDVVGALDAYGDEGLERRIDLATINGSVFVNNVSLGVYASIVQSDHYRDDKLGTTLRMLPELLGPEAEPFDLRFAAPGGDDNATADLLMVSNGPYRLDRLFGMGTRPRMDSGVLGIVSVRIAGPGQAAQFLAMESTGTVSRFSGWRTWTAEEFVVNADQPVPAGVDGEALSLDPPLRFVTHPDALRVRISPHHPGVSPSAEMPTSAARCRRRAGTRRIRARPRRVASGTCNACGGSAARSGASTGARACATTCPRSRGRSWSRSSPSRWASAPSRR